MFRTLLVDVCTNVTRVLGAYTSMTVCVHSFDMIPVSAGATRSCVLSSFFAVELCFLRVAFFVYDRQASARFGRDSFAFFNPAFHFLA